MLYFVYNQRGTTMVRKSVLIAACVVVVVLCSVSFSQRRALGPAGTHRVTQYSGGQIVYQQNATNVTFHDGYISFMVVGRNGWRHVTGTVLVEETP